MSRHVIPSAGELEILRVLWREGPSTVRDVHAGLPRGGDVEYNTVGKLLRIMTDKGLVACDDSSRAHVFSPRIEQTDTQGRLIHDLAERAFGGSAADLVVRAMTDRPLNRRELEEIKGLVADLEDEVG